jgi:hypothetical protein
MSLYVSPKVVREIKRLALDIDRRPHDLLIEGVNLMLRKHGRPSIEEINAS